MPEATVAAATAIIRSHEEFTRAGDLDAVMTNIDEDVVLLTAGAPLVQGADAFKAFYAQLFAMGRWQFGHDYHGAEVVGSTVFLHGVAEGSLTSADNVATEFANNFIHVLRPGADGRLRIWRAAFAPATA
jgi:ketosteroid isomerase-like protein